MVVGSSVALEWLGTSVSGVVCKDYDLCGAEVVMAEGDLVDSVLSAVPSPSAFRFPCLSLE